MNTFENIKDGDIFWCILSSTESQNYGDYGPEEPWQGKFETSERLVKFLYNFNKETGEIDYDTNAESLIYSPDQLFATKQEAVQAYKTALIKKASKLAAEIEEILKITLEL